MSRRNSCLLACAALVASVALVGHATHHPLLAAWLPSAVAMKQLTAMLILGHATAAFLLCLPGERRQLAQPLLTIAGLSLLMIPGALSEISHLENWHAFDPRASFYPSVVTICASAMLAARIVATLYLPRPWLVHGLGLIVALIGGLPVAGYALGLRTLYYFIRGYSTAMALPTALAFLCLGLANPLADGERR